MKFNKGKEEVNLMSPLVWAYVGDSVYELFIRTHLVGTTKKKPHELHLLAIRKVKAQAQAELLKKIKQFLTEEEKDIVRRTRNTDNHHIPKHANLADYSYATALEGLIGYLYLTKQDKRLEEILEFCLENQEEENKESC